MTAFTNSCVCSGLCSEWRVGEENQRRPSGRRTTPKPNASQAQARPHGACEAPERRPSNTRTALDRDDRKHEVACTQATLLKPCTDTPNMFFARPRAFVESLAALLGLAINTIRAGNAPASLKRTYARKAWHPPSSDHRPDATAHELCSTRGRRRSRRHERRPCRQQGRRVRELGASPTPNAEAAIASTSALLASPGRRRPFEAHASARRELGRARRASAPVHDRGSCSPVEAQSWGRTAPTSRRLSSEERPARGSGFYRAPRASSRASRQIRRPANGDFPSARCRNA